VLVGDDGDAHLLPQISSARFSQWECFHTPMIAFEPLYKCIAFPSRSQTWAPEEMHAFSKNAASLHVLQRFGFHSEQLGGFESGEIFNHGNTSSQAKEERRGDPRGRLVARSESRRSFRVERSVRVFNLAHFDPFCRSGS